MSDTQEMVQLEGSSKGPRKVAAEPELDGMISQMRSNVSQGERPLPTRPKNRDRERLAGFMWSDAGHPDAKEKDAEFSDYDKISSEGTPKATSPISGMLMMETEDDAEDQEGTTGPKVALRKPTRARLTKTPQQDNQDQLKKDPQELQRAHSDLLCELRMTHRDNRHQSIELRVLKRQNEHLREAYNKQRTEMAGNPKKFSKVERNKYIEHFQMMENDISYLRHELEKRDTHIEMLTKQTREANHEKGLLEGGNRQLQRQIREMSANLTECKDDLLRLQPSSQTSDSEIADRYSNLSQQIAGWVDDQTEDAETLEERFLGLKAVAELGLDLFAMHMQENHLKLAQEHPDSVPSILQYLIHCYIGQYVLGDAIYFYGLDVRNAGVLQQIEQGMTLLEPQRGILISPIPREVLG